MGHRDAQPKRARAGVGGGLPREAGWPLTAELAGGVLLARAVADKALAEEIAEPTLKNLLERTRAASKRSA
jgi:hypothetical protein